jgi:hypothetical protein
MLCALTPTLTHTRRWFLEYGINEKRVREKKTKRRWLMLKNKRRF